MCGPTLTPMRQPLGQESNLVQIYEISNYTLHTLHEQLHMVCLAVRP